ncbi:helix-turn-helix domain-containing protein [Cryobacterium sp. Y62]|uniref:helix-turn-helix domain-containing protein n=1 Tax=Cryobacterium sp. Y62 TaxID=2048284 RepID=UPI0011B07D9A|nr:helix-turn-helix domain-containing protein [Cryobacterium sp. Y62]
MDETPALMMWPDSMLRRYGDMLSVADVSCVLRLERRNVRCLLTSTDATTRLPGVKIGTSWRIARDQLRAYLIGHHNDDCALRSEDDERGSTS